MLAIFNVVKVLKLLVNDLQQNTGVLRRCWRKREMEDCYISKENWDRRNMSQATWNEIGQWTVSSPSRDKSMTSWNSLPQFPAAPLQQPLTLLHLLPHPLAPPPVPEASRDNNSNVPQSSSGSSRSYVGYSETLNTTMLSCYPLHTHTLPTFHSSTTNTDLVILTVLLPLRKKRQSRPSLAQ